MTTNEKNRMEEYCEDDEPTLPDTCPNCNFSYDEIDYEYQICHLCGYNNNTTQQKEAGDE